MRRGMQDAARSMHAECRACKQTVSRESDRPPPIRRSLFASREYNRAPERFSPAASKHDVDSDACVLPPENPPMRRGTQGSCRANCCAIRVSSLTPCFASAFFSTNRQDPLQSRAVNYRGEIQNHSGTRTKRPTL